jgi:hypothetical protein
VEVNLEGSHALVARGLASAKPSPRKSRFLEVC